MLEIRAAAHEILLPVVREGLSRLRDALAAVDRLLPWHVEKEMEGFLGCGDPERGFAWLECGPCKYQRLVTFSCKGRGFCPRCGGRRMAERSAHWVDRVIPHVPTRQWVLTVPWGRRWLLARNPVLLKGVHRIAMRILERWYAKQADAAKEGKTGSVTAIQRFGSDLSLNLHFHVIFLDGVYCRKSNGELKFRPVVPHTEDVERLVVSIAESCEKWLSKQGFGEDAEAPEEDDAQAVIQAAALAGKAALGERAGKRARRTQVLGGREVALPSRCAGFEGYNLHAGVGIQATNRSGLEQLCRYILRPPLAKSRLERQADGTVELSLKRAWSDGTTSFLFSPLELTERLVAIIPPAKANQILYRGVLAGNAAFRKEIVPRPKEELPEEAAARRSKRLTRHPRIKIEGERASWHELLQRVFYVDGFQCPMCGGRLELRCVVVGMPATHRILEGLRLATGPP